jgi:hypothetical protein
VGEVIAGIATAAALLTGAVAVNELIDIFSEDDTPDNVVPFPISPPKPNESEDCPKEPDRKQRCAMAYLQCLEFAKSYSAGRSAGGLTTEGMCMESLINCGSTDLPVIFPPGIVVK